jgi:DNA-binding transcriptional ArsR family regulator
MNNNGERLKRITLSILKKHPEGLTIRSLSEIIGVHRQTVTKYIMELKGAGMIHRRKVGPATLHYLKDDYPENFEKSDIQ